MSSSLDTKRAALHDISNKGGLPGGDKVREPRAASAMGRQLQYQPCASTSPGGACQIVSQPLADACVSIVWQGSGALLSSAAPLPPNVRVTRQAAARARQAAVQQQLQLEQQGPGTDSMEVDTTDPMDTSTLDPTHRSDPQDCNH